MEKTMRKLTLLTALAVLSACGGTDPGNGSQTLYVKAALDSDGSPDGTNISVEIRENDRAGAPITDAIVILKAQGGEQHLLGVLGGQRGTPLYAKNGFAWDKGFTLSIRRVKDSLDAALEMPGFTVITDPVSSTTFNRTPTNRFVVRWRDEFGRFAEYPEVKLERADIRQTLSEDRQELAIDAMRLVPTEEEQVTVTRTNKVLLQGGLDGSEWTATTHHRISFRVQ
jgi:hypothetical protein